MSFDVEECYRRYGPMVLRRCRRLLREEERAVDAMHDTFVRVLKNKDRLEQTSPASLLYRIATNVCLNQLRTLKRRPETPDEALLLAIAKLDETEDRTLAKSLLDRLFTKEKPSTRTMAVLHLVDGMTLEEVARETGFSVSGVRKRLRELSLHARQMEQKEGRQHEARHHP